MINALHLKLLNADRVSLNTLTSWSFIKNSVNYVCGRAHTIWCAWQYSGTEPWGYSIHGSFWGYSVHGSMSQVFYNRPINCSSWGYSVNGSISQVFYNNNGSALGYSVYGSISQGFNNNNSLFGDHLHKKLHGIITE